MRRYGRSQFFKDAARLGLTRDAAVSRVELRRRRDRLIITHHPDHGGDADKAARINAIYARMIGWLNERSSKAPKAGGPQKPRAEQKAPRRATLAEGLNTGAARVWGLALVAAATYAAFRGKRKP